MPENQQNLRAGSEIPGQREFNFDFKTKRRITKSDGLSVWHQKLDDAAREVAHKLGLPIGRLVEVRLKDGVIIRGNLRVGEVVASLKVFDRNKVALEIGGLVFFYAEMESCVRID